jgi:thiol-disulfide isomerase/thioredoxin
MRRLSYLTAIVAVAAFFALPGRGTTAVGQEKDKSAEADKGKAAQARAEEKKTEVKLQVGDAAPALQVEKFIKGAPVEKFKPGQIYIVEFWATWCGPCKVTMPHLTELQKKFKDKVTFIGVDVQEADEYNADTLKKVEAFVKKNDENMGYTVAFDGGKRQTDKAYMEAAAQKGIPTAFVITGDARIAFIGHPQDEEFEKTIQRLVDEKFDMKEAIAAAKERKAKEEAMLKAQEEAEKIAQKAQELIEDGKVDEGLAKMDEITKLNKDFAPMVEMQKFNLLMAEEQYDKAYKVAAKAIDGPLGERAEILNVIAWTIVDPETDVGERDTKLALKAAEKAVKLTDGKNAAILDTLARCYWLQGEKAKAIETQTKAVELAKKDESQPDEMKEALQTALDEYKKGDKVEKKADQPKKGKGQKEEDDDDDGDDD